MFGAHLWTMHGESLKTDIRLGSDLKYASVAGQSQIILFPKESIIWISPSLVVTFTLADILKSLYSILDPAFLILPIPKSFHHVTTMIIVRLILATNVNCIKSTDWKTFFWERWDENSCLVVFLSCLPNANLSCSLIIKMSRKLICE